MFLLGSDSWAREETTYAEIAQLVEQFIRNE